MSALGSRLITGLYYRPWWRVIPATAVGTGYGLWDRAHWREDAVQGMMIGLLAPEVVVCCAVGAVVNRVLSS